MKQNVNVLVTGVGAIIGYGIIKSLRKSRYNCHIVGMDIYPDAVGQAWCDEFVQAIPAADPNYVDFVKQQMERFHIDLVMFGTEQEIERLSNAKDELGEFYHKMVMNRPELLELSNDKWETYCFLKQHGLPAIPSSLDQNFDEVSKQLGCPLLFKPRRSYAGKGMAIVKNAEELQYHKQRVAPEQYMVQKLIGDAEHEYTAAVFGLGDGTSLNPIILRRKLSQEGATAKATRVNVPELEQQIRRLTEIAKPIGPTNYQFRQEGSQYYLLEINPRISSSTSIRMALGYNESEMCVDWYVNHVIPAQPTMRDGTVLRYIEDQLFV